MKACNISDKKIREMQETIYSIFKNNGEALSSEVTKHKEISQTIANLIYDFLLTVNNKDEYLGSIINFIESSGRDTEMVSLLRDQLASRLAENDLATSQLQLERLDATENVWHVYLTHTTAQGRMQDMFDKKVLECSYIDRVNGKEILTDVQVNKNILEFKRTLLNQIITYINKHLKNGMQALQYVEANDEIDPRYYSYVMTYGNILSDFVDSVLDNKCPEFNNEDLNKPTELENVFNAIFILNNFDYLVKSRFAKILNIDEASDSTVDQTVTDKYSIGLTGLQNALWGAESLEAKGIKNSISNLAKLLTNTIHRVDDAGRIIPGQYLSPNDLSMMAQVLKRAEIEYFQDLAKKANGDTRVSFMQHPKRALKTLIKYAIDKSVQNKKILMPLYKYLYEGFDGEYSIESIYNRTIDANTLGSRVDATQIPDVEALFAYELLKTVPVIYTSYVENGSLKFTDEAGSFYAPAYIKECLAQGIATIVSDNESYENQFSTKDDKPILLVNDSDSSTPTVVTEDYIENLTLSQVEHILNDDTFKSNAALLIGVNIDNDFVHLFGKTDSTIEQMKYNAVRAVLKYMLEANVIIHQVLETKTEKQNKNVEFDVVSYAEASVKDWVKTDGRKGVYYDVADKAIMLAGQKPVVVISTVSGNKVPIYRLGSTGFEDTYYIQLYLSQSHMTAQNADNIIVANPGLFTNKNSEKSPKENKGKAQYNDKYTTSTAIRLEAYRMDDNTKNEGGSEMKVAESFMGSFFGDFIDMMTIDPKHIHHMFGTQIMTYSDKVSVILKLFNADAEIRLGNDGSTTTLRLAHCLTLQNLWLGYQGKYYSRIVKSIFNDWREVTDAINEKFGTTIAPEVNSWYDLEDLFEDIETIAISKGYKNGLSLIREAIYYKEHQAPVKKHLEITIDKHYSIVDKKLHVNNELRLMHTCFTTEDGMARFVANYESLFIKKLKQYKLTGILQTLVTNKKYELACEEILSLEDQEEAKKFKENGQVLIVKDGKLHPLLKKYLLMTNMLKDAYLGITVKQPYIHKIKSYPNIEQIDADYAKLRTLLIKKASTRSTEEKENINKLKQEIFDLSQDEHDERVKAAMKRMVILPATCENYAQGLLNGVPEDYNIAIINDDNQDTENFKGEIHGQDIHDGSATGNPFMSVLEENSLIAKGIRGTKKPIGMYSGDGFAMLFKYAQFPITNAKIQASMQSAGSMYQMMRKMNNVPFSTVINDSTHHGTYFCDKDGNPYVDVNGQYVRADLSKNMFGRGISISALLKGRRIFFSKGNRYYEILDYRHAMTQDAVGRTSTSDDNNYRLYTVEVDKNGRRLSSEVDKSEFTEINTIFDLWEFFGGQNSMELKNGHLVQSELSIQLVTNIINNVGFQTNKLEDGERASQRTYEQPLKHAMIHMVANTSAVKNGGTNINSAKEWTSKAKDSHLLYVRLKTSGFGSQMDANHESDDAELTEMSQVITSLSSNGISIDKAQEAYEAIAAIIKDSMVEIDKRLEKVSQDKLDDVIMDMSKELVREMSDDDKISVSLAAYEALSRTGEHRLPLSNPNFYSLLTKMVISKLSNSSIRRKYTGLTAILHPSAKIMTIYDIDGSTVSYSDALKAAREHFPARDRETIGNDDLVLLQLACLRSKEIEAEIRVQYNQGLSIGKLRQLAKSFLTEKVNYSDLKLYDTILTNEGKEIYIESISDLVQLNKLPGEITKVLYRTRDLRPVFVTYTDTVTNKKYNTYNMDASYLSACFEDVIGKDRRLPTDEEQNMLVKFFTFAFPGNWKANPYSIIVNGIEDKKQRQKAINDCRKKLSLFRQRQNELLKAGYTFAQYNGDWSSVFGGIENGHAAFNLDLRITDAMIQSNSELLHRIDNYILDEAEIILPKVFKTKYHLEDLPLCSITEDHFYSYIDDVMDKDPQSHMQIVCGNKTYGIVFDTNPSSSKNAELYGKLVYVDENGNHKDNKRQIQFNVPKGVFAYQKQVSGGVQTTFVIEIGSAGIETQIKNIINSLNGVTFVRATENASNLELKILRTIKYIGYRYNNIPAIKKYYKGLLDANSDDFSAFERTYKNVIAKAMYNSYLMTNHIISARVPSQGLQSFMSMKIVSFTDDDSNNSYVSIWQPWLQGSR